MSEQNLPVKSEPVIEEVTQAVLSFSDPNIIAGVFKQLGWTFNDEIAATLSIIRQNGNLGAKLSALKHLRSLIKESAEAAGLVGKVSKTIQGPDGAQTTFSANRIALALNPVKQVESKPYVPRQESKLGEPSDGQTEQQTEFNRSGPGAEDARRPVTGADTGRDSGSSPERRECGGETPPTDGARNEIRDTNDLFGNTGASSDRPNGDDEAGRPSDNRNLPGTGDDGLQSEFPGTAVEQDGNPCVQRREPTCDHTLFPGISGASAENNSNPDRGNETAGGS